MFTSTLLEAAAPQGAGSMQLVLLVGIVVIFYFFMIRPQMQRQKKEKNFRSSLAKGDKIITIGGIYGRIASVEENTVLVEVDDNLKLRMDRNAIREKQPEK
ncbi:MAG: preprotein translocase subunit YajC [Bacteroidetes bacterium]|nr:preprotein translocase subunit YajC [Bacteroidota bacterium]